MRVDLLEHCLQLDPPFHAAHPPGVLVERVDGDVAQLYELCARFGVRVISSGLLLIGVLVLYIRVDVRVGLVMIAFTLVSTLVLYRLRHLAVGFWGPARQASADLYGFLEEHLSGTEDLRASGATRYAIGRLLERTQALLRTERRARVVGSATYNVGVILLAIGSALAIGMGIALLQSGEGTLGTIYLLFAYAELLQRPIDTITRELEVLQRATASLARIRELFAFTSAIADGPGAELPRGALGIEFDQVSFAYADEDRKPADERPVEEDAFALPASDELAEESPLLAGGEAAAATPALAVAGRKPAPIRTLHEIAFALAPGEVLGLLGRTGSGKTTLTRLMLRLFDPTAGAIRLGGVDLRTLRLEELRRQVAIVTQDIQLFEGSLRDNLTLFDRSIPDQRLSAALAEVGLGGWLAGLPQGLDSPLAADGGGLSAGEAQLLAFARVFLRDPAVVILDEASARLDPATERAIEQAISRLLRPEGRRRTAIIIAHRLKTVQRADQILILERGQVAEHGPREALARNPSSRFAELLRVGMEEALA
jgi:ABC-type multidrug transport system fused ATPase/permease subunit